MKKCPFCGAELNDDSLFCTQCGKQLPNDYQCPHCGAKVYDGDIFCQNCGEKLSKDSVIPQTDEHFDNDSNETSEVYYEEEVSKNGFKKYLPYIIGGVIVLGIIGYFSSNDSFNNNGYNTNAIATVSDSIDSNTSDIQITKEQITKRLEEIFDVVVKNDAQDCDERFFSSDFKRIYKDVEDIDKRFHQGEVGFWDTGFWDESRDYDSMSIVVNDVYDIKDNEAKAKVTFKFTYPVVYSSPPENDDEVIQIIFENGKWVLDDFRGYKKQMKEYIEESKNASIEPTSSTNEYQESTVNTSSSKTFANEQYVTMYLANQTFRSSNGFTIRFDGDLRMYAEGDFAGVVSVLRYNSTAALLRYGGGQYTEGKISVQIVGDKLQLTDPIDGTVFYQK